MASAKVADLIVNLSAISRLTNNCNELEIYTDSSYFCAGWDAGWIEKWKNNGWVNGKGEPVAHADYWKMIDEKLSKLGLRPIFHLMEHHPWTNWFKRQAEFIEGKM